MNDKEVVKLALMKELEFLVIKCYNEGVTSEEQHTASLLMKELSRRSKKSSRKSK